jgi:dihydrodipicolinate synthase/N-acetylneuraminate lyase
MPMDRRAVWPKITGCYIPIPTLFHDADLELNLPGMRRHVRFLIDQGVREGNGVILVGGGAGEFSSLLVEERLKMAEAVIDEASGRVGVIVGVQATSQRDALALCRGAERLGAVGVQAAPPFYHPHTDDDVFEWIAAMAQAAPRVGIVFYTTYWTGFRTSLEFIGRLETIPQVVSIKWASPHYYEFERVVRTFAKRLLFIDNQLLFGVSHMLGGRALNLHPSNYWPAWGVRLWQLLEGGEYRQAQEEMSRVVAPYYDLCGPIGEFTGGEGHLDKLCMELIGLEGGRCRPPIRDIRPLFRERVRTMLKTCGVPGCA